MTGKRTTAAGYAKDEELDLCQGPDCNKVFKWRKGKRFCSARCRARHADDKRFTRIKQAIEGRTFEALSDSDIRILGRIVAAKANGKPKRPFKLNASHGKILDWLRSANGDSFFKHQFLPAVRHIQGITDPGRRCRELRAAGYLESFRVGRFVAYRLKQNVNDV